MIYLLLQGCLMEPSASLTGRILNSSSSGVSEANVTIRNESGDVFSETTADDEGLFSVALPPLSIFFLETSAQGMPATAFTGFAGEGQTVAPENALRLRSESEVNAVITEFSCGGSVFNMVDGRVAVDIPGQDAATLPAVTTATIRAIDSSGSIHDACYLSDDEGNPLEATGNSGRYAILGLPEGVTTLRISVQYDVDTTEDIDHTVYVPQDGATRLDPTLIPL